MSITRIQAIMAHGALVTSITTGALTTTSGNTIILATAVFTGATAFSSVGDSNGNSYGTANAIKAGVSTEARQFSNGNITGGAGHTFTLTLAGAGYPTIIACEVNFSAGSGTFDKFADGAENGSATHSTGTTATLADANEFVYANAACYNTGGSLANSDGTYTQDQLNLNGTDENALSAYKTVAATTAVSWVGFNTGSAGVSAQLVCTYRAAGGASRGLFLPTNLNGLGAGGSFFGDRL